MELKKHIIEKELEIIKAEITNSGKTPELADKISREKLKNLQMIMHYYNKYGSWIPKKKFQMY